MTTRIEMVSDTIPLSFAAKLLVDKHIAGLPVTSELGELVGVLAWKDVLTALKKQGRNPAPDDEEGDFYGDRAVVEMKSGLDELRGTVGEHMATELVSIGLEGTVGDAAKLMRARRVHRVLVVDDGGNLAGLVSAFDVVCHIADE
ncbi:MAG: CBS domain-containing protein [Myxococcota bacterium]